jgi:hypothetical protein
MSGDQRHGPGDSALLTVGGQRGLEAFEPFGGEPEILGGAALEREHGERRQPETNDKAAAGQAGADTDNIHRGLLILKTRNRAASTPRR